MAKPGEKVMLSEGESDLYRKWIFWRDFGIMPHELDLIPIEYQNAFLVMKQYQIKADEVRADEEAKKQR